MDIGLLIRSAGFWFESRSGSKHYLLVDSNGTSTTVILTGANYHGSTQLRPLIDGMSKIASRRGHPLVRPASVKADQGYGCERYRTTLRKLGIFLK